MCTLLFGWRVTGDAPLVLAANRDEDPARPSEGPTVLRQYPRIVGGRDLRAGGTWLAVRGTRCAVAILNRRPRLASPGTPARKPPSRGLLAIAVAAAGDGDPDAAARAAQTLLAADDYAACSLVIAGPEAARVVHHRGGRDSTVVAAEPGWHAITHEDLDDANEPRTASLLRELHGFRPHSADEALDRLGALVARHGPEPPAVCLHDGVMRTVSTARLVMTPEHTRFWHGEGPACTASLTEYSALIEAA